MVCVQLEFPLGMYYALSDDHNGPEWAPSPVRLIGALLAAAEEVPSDDTDADRAVLQHLCESSPPTLYAPPAAPSQAQMEAPREGPALVAELRGASRWAPRNPGASELKRDLPGSKTVNVAEVDKSGVAIGKLPVVLAWPEIELNTSERERLRRMLNDVAWLGTSRSPVVCQLIDEPEAIRTPRTLARWTPLSWEARSDTQIRVPSPDLLSLFDQAFEARRAVKNTVESAGWMPQPRVDPWPYEVSTSTHEEQTFDPQHWGQFNVVALDPESEMTPRASGAYLTARSLRVALMDAFAEREEEHDAPVVLHGHGDRPHLAIVPLPFAGPQHGDGRVLGFAVLYPHPDRAPAVEAEAREVEGALARFLPGTAKRRSIRVHGAGSFLIAGVGSPPVQTLCKQRYIGPARHWATVTPVVHSRWRKGDDAAALAAQVTADCAHVGLPAPIGIERLRSSALRGAGNEIIPEPARLRPEWRGSIAGPHSHLRLEFDREVVGPIVLGKARHFGLGLCLPVEGPGADE